MGELLVLGLVVYGSTLSLWSLLTNAALIVVLFSALRGGGGGGGGSGPSHGKLCPSCVYLWLVSNFTAVQLVTAGFVLPLSVDTENRGRWPFGRQLCFAWLVTRILLVAESFWTLFAVTLDRFFGRVTPLAYDRYGRNRALGVLAVLGTWAIAVTVTAVAVCSIQVNDEATAGRPTANEGIVDEELCATSINFDHSLFIALGSFALPSAFTVAMIVILAAVELISLCRRKTPIFTGFPRPAATTTTLEQSLSEGQEPGSGSCLAAVVSVDLCFVMGWAPAFATNVFIHVCQGSVCIDPAMWTVVAWLGHTTAGLAPLLWFLDRSTRLKAKRMVCSRRRRAAADGPAVGLKLRNRRMEINLESPSRTSISESGTSKIYSELSVL